MKARLIPHPGPARIFMQPESGSKVPSILVECEVLVSRLVESRKILDFLFSSSPWQQHSNLCTYQPTIHSVEMQVLGLGTGLMVP